MVSTSETSINALSTYLDLGSSGNWSYRSDYANFGSTEEMQTNSKKPYLSVIELTGYNSDGLFSTVFLPIFDFKSGDAIEGVHSFNNDNSRGIYHAEWTDDPIFTPPESLIGHTWEYRDDYTSIYIDSNRNKLFDSQDKFLHRYNKGGDWGGLQNKSGTWIINSNNEIISNPEVNSTPTFLGVSFQNSNTIIEGLTTFNHSNNTYNEYFDGTNQNDFFRGNKGDDVMYGLEGQDTSIYSGKFTDYSFTRETNSLVIRDQRTVSNDGSDTLHNIEYIQFSDQTVEESKVDIVKTYSGNFSDYKFYNKGNSVYQIKTASGYDDITGLPLLTFTGEAATSAFKNISVIVDIKGTFDQVTGLNTDDAKMFRLYNAAFKRLPDANGLKYWISKYTSRENDDRAVAQSFLVSAEFKERYGANVSDNTYVNNLYQNVLGRLPDSSGLNYWLGQLNSGAETRYEVLLGFAESAENKNLFTDMTGFD